MLECTRAARLEIAEQLPRERLELVLLDRRAAHLIHHRDDLRDRGTRHDEERIAQGGRVE